MSYNNFRILYIFQIIFLFLGEQGEVFLKLMIWNYLLEYRSKFPILLDYISSDH